MCYIDPAPIVCCFTYNKKAAAILLTWITAAFMHSSKSGKAFTTHCAEAVNGVNGPFGPLTERDISPDGADIQNVAQ